MNSFISALRFSKDIKLVILPRACSFLLDLLKVEETCCSKLSSESIRMPSKFSCLLVVIDLSPIDASGDIKITQK